MNKDFRGVVIGSPWIRCYVIVNYEDTAAGVPVPRQQSAYMHQRERGDAALRRSLFYFDHIDWPRTNVFEDDFSSYKVLEEQGFLTHSSVTIPNEFLQVAKSAAFGEAHIAAFHKLETEQPGCWSFAAVAEDVPWIGVPTALELEDKRAIQFELINALPVPSVDAQFAEILDYRERRRDELLTMRAYLDELYGEIMRSADVPHAKIVALNKLDVAINGVARTMRESGIRGKWGSMAIDLLLDIPGAWGTGEQLAPFFHVPTEFGAALLTGLGVYRFAKQHLKSPIPRKSGPLAYLARASSESLIELPPNN